ncbi:protein kinase [Streptomyces sp. CAU 1734]|uniref:protein kinase domain-containing protein n=1 Tax=Streptomyces sp. CAU 1734 TaxID=3140360 RepID=UPI003261197A
MTDPLLPGDPVRLGPLRLLGRLGAGGMGQVYLGRTPGGRLVAVKTVHQHLADDPRFRARFRREAAAARAVTGAHTAAVLDADPDSPVPWLATAFLAGVTLRRAVAAAGPLPAAAVRALGAALAEALTAIHGAGLVHRDLKPSNVLVTADGPRVIDFGIARAVGELGLTGAGDIVGTPGFIAPEQITGAAPVTAAADVFALGSVLGFAATGRNPFGDGTAAILLYRAVHEEPGLAAIPAEVRDVIAECLRKEPGARPSPAALLGRLADPAAPLWWRTEPLRTLTAESGPGAAEAVPPATLVASAGTSVPPTALLPRAEGTEGAVRPVRRTWVRRGLLIAAGGGLAGLFGVAVARSGGGSAGADGSGTAPAHRAGSAAPGALRWSLTTGEGAFGGLLPVPAAPAGKRTEDGVLVHSATGALDGRLHLRRADSGAARWEREARGGAPAGWQRAGGVLTAAGVGVPAVRLSSGAPATGAAEVTPGALWSVIAGDTLVLSYPPGGGARSLRGLGLRAGAASWGLELPGERPPAVLGTALLLAGRFDDGVVCVDAATGEVRWRQREPGRVVAMAALPSAGRFAVLGEDGALRLLDIRDGSPAVRSRRVPGPGVGTTALADGAGTGIGLLITGGVLHGFGVRDGRPRWERPTSGLESNWPVGGGGVRGPVLTPRGLLHWSSATVLEAVGLPGGGRRWERRLPGIARLPPVSAGGRVYAAAGEVCVQLGLAGGAEARRWREPGLLELAADERGWYARTSGGRTVRAYNRAPVSGGGSSASTDR